jgi:hypothetical protein
MQPGRAGMTSTPTLAGFYRNCKSFSESAKEVRLTGRGTAAKVARCPILMSLGTRA